MNKLYRFDFALIMLTGNATRYHILRDMVARDPSVAPRWFPIRTWYAEDPLAFLPGFLRLRLRHLLDSRLLFLPSRSDAILIHAFETYYLYTIFQRKLGRKVVIIKNPDGHLAAPNRGRIGNWRLQFTVRQTDAFVFWSRLGAEETKQIYPDIPDEKIHVLHPGIDLTKWPMRSAKQPGERFKILFVGGDLMRKGADTLLDAFEARLSDTCELHLATFSPYLTPDMKARIERIPNVHLHLDLQAGSPELQELFRDADVFALPTNNDQLPWVAIEALAIGVPTVITSVGAIPEIVLDGETGLLVPPKDPDALASAIERLRVSPDLRETFARQGRAHIEANFDAIRNTPLLLDLMKRLSDERRASRQVR